MISVYVLEDDEGLREDTVYSLNAEGMQSTGAANGHEFAALCAAEWPDVAVIDRMLEHEDGLTIARNLISSQDAKKMGIVFLTSLGAIDQKLEGLHLGDAYLVKPVDMRELAATIQSVHRRIHGVDENGADVCWHLFPRHLKLVSPEGKSVGLSSKEAQLLTALANANGKVVPIRTLVEMIGENWMVYEKNRLELIFSRLRQKIRAISDLSTHMIRSNRNEGYQLDVSLKLSDD